MAHHSTSLAASQRPRVRRGLGLVVGLAVAVTPLAIAPAAPAATHHTRAYSSACQTLLGGGPGSSAPKPDGVGSLLSSVIQGLANLICGTNQAQAKAAVPERIAAVRWIKS
ncbi:MAG: hypothetical protein QOJ35_672 [Solirubrobacteraceae bacterium]|jgi:hypothetical protein|nr:hypothetical protein [Solirubrobacteraceae bacterium]